VLPQTTHFRLVLMRFEFVLCPSVAFGRGKSGSFQLTPLTERFLFYLKIILCLTNFCLFKHRELRKTKIYGPPSHLVIHARPSVEQRPSSTSLYRLKASAISCRFYFFPEIYHFTLPPVPSPRSLFCRGFRRKIPFIKLKDASRSSVSRK